MTEHADTADTADSRPLEELHRIAAGWPPALAKATTDRFLYAVGLVTGHIIVCELAEDIGHGWVHLGEVKSVSGGQGPRSDLILFARGLDVRLAAIAWACDAPFGS